MREENKKLHWKPFLLSLLVIVLDQVSKALVVRYIPENTIGKAYLGDFLWLVHVRNNAVAFSMGTNMPVVLKYIFFVGFPILLMVALAYLIATPRSDKEFTRLQKWCFAGIFGGGIGNIIDRVFRSLRVVDFISVKFYGLFGMERFPTWNIGDSAVVVFVILLIITFIVQDMKERKTK